MRVQRFSIYAERGLSRKRVSVWLYDGRLFIAYRAALLAKYAYRYDRTARRLSAVDTPQIMHSTYASPQLEMWELDDEQWQKVARRPYERHQQPGDVGARQLAFPFLAVGLLAALLMLHSA